MSAFSTFRSITADTPFDRVIDRLQAHPEIRVVFLLGSTATGPAAWSDFDLLLVTRSGESFDFEMAYVERRATDVVFVSESEIERLLTLEEASTPQERDVLGWLSTARAASTARGNPTDWPKRAARILSQSRIPRAEIYYRWVEANFTLLKLRRYATSEDPSHRNALEILLARALSELPRDYTTSREIPWLGDKEAVAFAAREDAEFLTDLQTALRTRLLDEKTELYADLMGRAFAGIGACWSEQQTAGGWFRYEGRPDERSRWESLLR